jgi:23S rRNA (pseudouridine1915-N3)-methyltransferase
MKFSELTSESWPDLQLYLDTCIIPISGLTGAESPWEATDKVARTGQWLAPLEHTFHGRTVTMPAFHYYNGSSDDTEKLNGLCIQMRKSGFRYVIAICGQPLGLSEKVIADLIVQPASGKDEPDNGQIRKSVTELWKQLSEKL